MPYSIQLLNFNFHICHTSFRFQLANFHKCSTSYRLKLHVLTNALLPIAVKLKFFHYPTSYGHQAANFHKFATPYSFQALIFTELKVRRSIYRELIVVRKILFSQKWTVTFKRAGLLNQLTDIKLLIYVTESCYIYSTSINLSAMVKKCNDTSLYVFKMPDCTKSFSCTLLMMSYTSSLTATLLKLPKGPSLSPVYNLIWQQKNWQ